MTEKPVRVTAIIVNHNYERFLRTAIDSVLGQRYDNVQTIVVDDGSTDGSRDVISSYGESVCPIFKSNGGMTSAVNAAAERIEGSIVMIVDADDFLHPDAVAAVVGAWRPSCAKVQFRLSLADIDGNRIGVDPPWHVAMPSGNVLPTVIRTGRYVTPITAGNAYSTRVLRLLLPLPETGTFRNSADGFLNTVVPFYGDVVSVEDELGTYRVHGNNLWALNAQPTSHRLRQATKHELEQQAAMEATAAERGLQWPASVMLRNVEHVIVRMCSLRLDRASHPAPHDSVWSLTRSGATALSHADEMGALERALYAVTLIAVAVLPAPAIPAIVGWVLGARPRPAWARVCVQALRWTRRRAARRNLSGSGLPGGPQAAVR